MNIIISSGHSLRVRGARGPSPWGLDEVDQNRRITDRVAAILRATSGVTVTTFHDNSSTTVAQNLNNIINFHNSRTRDRDVSVHFNAFQPTQGTRGTEVCHRNQPTLAATVSRAMADAGRFTNRGAKHRTNLGFLNRCTRPAILLEVCFVDARGDVNLYHQHFEPICQSIARSISGRSR